MGRCRGYALRKPCCCRPSRNAASTSSTLAGCGAKKRSTHVWQNPCACNRPQHDATGAPWRCSPSAQRARPCQPSGPARRQSPQRTYPLPACTAPPSQRRPAPEGGTQSGGGPGVATIVFHRNCAPARPSTHLDGVHGAEAIAGVLNKRLQAHGAAWQSCAHGAGRWPSASAGARRLRFQRRQAATSARVT